LYFSGTRYTIGGDAPLSSFRDWIKESFGDDVFRTKAKVKPTKNLPTPKIDDDFINGIKKLKIDFSIDGEDRLIRSHGHTLYEIQNIRSGKYGRIPDAVVWPESHDEVVEIVKLANELNVVLIPFGGGTSVSGSVTCPQNETDRCIAVLDTSQMNRMLWIDKANFVARFEAGIVGQDLDRVLASEGFTLGHEPDSYEFSTLGGWVATRASGIKKNSYGNIEDLVVQVKMVTTKGILERNIFAPRVSHGPDFDHIVLGSEGSFGVITEVLVKVRPLPPVQKYGSLVFKDFESGIRCLREVARKRCQPASIRLMDNEQFMFGQTLKHDEGLFGIVVDKLKKFALTSIKGCDLKKVAVVTLLFEGTKNEVERNEKQIFEIAKKHSGFSAGAANGLRGYVSR
jgi:alkyldihydroxyacetonephosphate synthase